MSDGYALSRWADEVTWNAFTLLYVGVTDFSETLDIDGRRNSKFHQTNKVPFSNILGGFATKYSCENLENLLLAPRTVPPGASGGLAPDSFNALRSELLANCCV